MTRAQVDYLRAIYRQADQEHEDARAYAHRLGLARREALVALGRALVEEAGLEIGPCYPTTEISWPVPRAWRSYRITESFRRDGVGPHGLLEEIEVYVTSRSGRTGRWVPLVWLAEEAGERLGPEPVLA